MFDNSLGVVPPTIITFVLLSVVVAIAAVAMMMVAIARHRIPAAANGSRTFMTATPRNEGPSPQEAGDTVQEGPYPPRARWFVQLIGYSVDSNYYAYEQPVATNCGTSVSFFDIETGSPVFVRNAKAVAFQLPPDGSEKYATYGGFNDDDAKPGSWIIETIGDITDFGTAWRSATQPTSGMNELKFIDSVDGLEVVMMGLPVEAYPEQAS